ncbi:MAG: hypothetical protein JST39_22430, partial [Bacteroidetes bacterium]|nr:hypothetical protein [Bacteroidota bacterium]
RNGNILVGAPLGGVLTNLLGGLQVKTGTVSVFTKKNASPSGIVAPTQQISSPRNSNSILNIVQSSLLMGFSMDNSYDMNCDGIGDIIVGEPASSGVQLISANVAGGSAYVFTGNSDGTYSTTPAWTLGSTPSNALGVNVASLTGYSVAGIRHTAGSAKGNNVMAGAPGMTLNFGTGLLNMGNTLGTLFGLVAGNNGVGKSFASDPGLCSTNFSSLPLNIINFNAVATGAARAQISWDVVTEKNINSYTIERSTDAIHWEIFGILPGNQSSNAQAHFSITDNHPNNGVNYYRIQQMDIDNSIFYTEIKMVNFGSNVSGRLSAINPFGASITLRLNAESSGNAQTLLLDLTGKVISRQESRVTTGMNVITI